MNGKKVLLVYDEKNTLDTYCFLLSKEGYHVVTADNGIKALEEICQQPFDLVITDLTIKCKNSHVFLEEMKALFPILPVMVLTNNLSEIVRRFASLMGACALIEKTCSYEIFISSIKKLLNQH